MGDKRTTEDEVVAELTDGMTVGIGGWGSRRKPMSLIRAILRSDVKDLTIVSYGGPDVGLLCAAGRVRKVIYGFVSLDSIPLEPHFRAARQSGAVDAMELDEGMFQWGLYAAALRLPFLPTRAGIGSDVMRINPELATVTSPYDGEELDAVRAGRRNRDPESRRYRRHSECDPRDWYRDLHCYVAIRSRFARPADSPGDREGPQGRLRGDLHSYRSARRDDPPIPARSGSDLPPGFGSGGQRGSSRNRGM